MTDFRAPLPTSPVGETFAWMGFDIPVDLIRLTGAGPESFEAISRWHIDQVDRAIGYTSNASVVEIGCGVGRDAIPLTQVLGPNGSYVGIDIIKPSIDWCAHNITPRYPNFRFVHYDVADQLHNPGGKLGIPDCYIPAPGSLGRHDYRILCLHAHARAWRSVLSEGVPACAEGWRSRVCNLLCCR